MVSTTKGKMAGSKQIQKSKFSMSVPQTSVDSSSKSNGKNKRKQSIQKHLANTHDDEDQDDDDEEEEDQDQQSVDSMDRQDDEEEADTDQEIENSKKVGASKKTAKRKRRATSPTSFGATLRGLLGLGSEAPSSGLLEADGLEGAEAEAEDEDEDEDSKKIKKQKKSQPSTSTAILSMAPHLRRSAASTTLNARAARLALDQKKKREERAHVTDVIGGWGPPGQLPDEESEQIRLSHLDEEKRQFLENDRKEWETEGGTKGYEKKLRKVAQRGVVKLFNAIRAAQSTTTEDVQAANSEMPKPSSLPGGKKQNALGGKESALADLSKSNFLDLIRSGGTGSKTAKKVTA